MKLTYTTAQSLDKVDIDALYGQGIRFIMLDIDNTITKWRSYDITPAVSAWLASAREKGMTLFLFSNNHVKERSQALAQTVGAMWCAVEHKKPSKKAFDAVISFLGADRECCVMIGDQMYGDMLGAKRAGIRGILLDPICSDEAVITKLLRIWERLMGRNLVFRGEEQK